MTQNTYFPINLRLAGKSCVVVGGGEVAARKTAALLEAGASVRVISPDVGPELEGLVAAGRISHQKRTYQDGDLSGMALVFAATSNADVNRHVAREATQRNILVDVVDDPEAGNFISPATVFRGELVLTVSTSGKAPAVSRVLRQRLEKEYGPEYAAVVQIHQAVREKLLTENKSTGYTTAVLRRFADSELPQLIKASSITDIDRLLLHIFGPGFSLAELGVAYKEVP